MNTQPLIIQNARIITKDNISPEKSIIIHNGIFQSINEEINQQHLETIQPKKIINAKTCYVTPGLIDNHIHLILNGAKDIITYVNTTSDFKLKQYAEANMKQSLIHGITTLRDMGDTARIISKIKQKRKAPSYLPHLFSSGQMLARKNGHVKKISKSLSTNIQQNNVAVDEQIAQKADFIKLIISGGLLTPGSSPLKSELSTSIIKNVCKKAKQKNIPVAAHVYSNQDISTALDAGVTSLEHGIWASSNSLKEASKKNIVFTPTLKAAYDIIEHKDVLPNYMVRNADVVLSKAPKFIKNAKKHHVLLAMGTDAGTPFNYHGENAKELQYLIENGLTPSEAIQSATTIPSKQLPVKNFIGNIKLGYSADLLILTKNPLDDITAFQNNIKNVISKGICINPKKLK